MDGIVRDEQDILIEAATDEERERILAGVKRSMARMEVCKECDEYLDDTAGNPMPRPCRLTHWTACKWRDMARNGNHPDPRCPWHKMEDAK
jgi:hypothetical protein